MQHMKYYLRASYNCAAHEDGSCVAHKIELACSTQKLILVSHASSVRVTRQKYKNTRMLPHASVNLDVSCTVCCSVVTRGLSYIVYVNRSLLWRFVICMILHFAVLNFICYFSAHFTSEFKSCWRMC